MKPLIIAGDMMMSIFANLEKMGIGPIFFVFFFWFLAWRRLYGEKTVRKGENMGNVPINWFLSEGEESEALIRVAFDSLGQKQRVFEPYSLSL